MPTSACVIFYFTFVNVVEMGSSKKRDRSKERKKKKHTREHSDDEQHTTSSKRKDKERFANALLLLDNHMFMIYAIHTTTTMRKTIRLHGVALYRYMQYMLICYC